MKVRIYLSITIAFSFLGLFSCNDQGMVYINGNLRNGKDIKTVYLLKPDTIQSITYSIVDSASVSNGDFLFKFAQPHPEFYELLVGGARIDIIVRNGEALKLKLDLADSTGAYQISGSHESEKMLEISHIQQKYDDKVGQLDKLYYTELEKAVSWRDSDATMTRYDLPIERCQQEYSNNLVKFIDQNESSLSALFAALRLDRGKYEKYLIQFSTIIKKDFPENSQVQKFASDMAITEPVSVGHKAPEFFISDAKGENVSLKNYKGKNVLLVFWASWSKVCRHQNPQLLATYTKFKTRKFDILSISLNSEKSNWLTAIKCDSLPWKQVCEFKRYDSEIVRRYRVTNLPYNYLIDSAGNIAAKNLSITQLNEFLQNAN